MSTGKNQSIIYPNSSLNEVICEVRFPGEPAIECHRDTFYSNIRKKYPKIMVPQSIPGQFTALEPYHFKNEAENSSVLLSMNKFAFSEKKYEGHEKFLTEFLNLALLLKKSFSLKKINRLGYRYINIIPYTRENGLVPIKRFFTVGIDVPKKISNNFTNLSLLFISNVENGSITTRLETMIQPITNQEAFLLDFDFAITENLDFKNLKAYVYEAHKHTRDLFESIITDEYRQFLKGDIL